MKPYFYEHLFRPADYIEQSIANLSGHLLIGGLFVLIILYLFLFNFRTAFISALAIPVSLIGAVIVLLETGVNLNIMVLAAWPLPWVKWSMMRLLIPKIFPAFA